MAPPSGGGRATTTATKTQDWIPVTWLPHTASAAQVQVTVIGAAWATSPSSSSLSGPLADNSPLKHTHQHHYDYNNDGIRIRLVLTSAMAGPALSLLAMETTTAARTTKERATTTAAEAAEDDSAANNDNNTATMLFAATDYPVQYRWDSTTGTGTTVKLPLRWRDLPRDAVLECTLLGSGSATVASTSHQQHHQELARATLPLFSTYGRLQTGLHRIPWQPLSSSSSTLLDEEKKDEETIATSAAATEYDPVWEATRILHHLTGGPGGTVPSLQPSQSQQPQTVLPRTPTRSATTSTTPHKHQQRFTLDQIRPVPWLDQLQQERCQQVLQEATAAVTAATTGTQSITRTSHGWLILELPTLEIPILYEETFYPTPSQGASGTVVPLDWTVRHKAKTSMTSISPPEQSSTTTVITMIPPLTSTTADQQHDPLDLVKVLDYENEEDNPTEDKYRTLAHDLLRGLVDPALKPDRKQLELLQNIIESPSYHLTREEKDLLWRFRFSLVDHRQACSKFLLAVDWTVDSEVVQAAELLEQWRKRSPIAVTDALRLLGKNVAFSTNALVRSYAIDTLAAAPDSELRLYLLQLVQAVKYETSPNNSNGSQNNNTTDSSSGGSALDTTRGATPVNDASSSLAAFLVQRASQNFELANFLYWYLKVELENPTYGARYRDMFSLLEAHLCETEFRASRTIKPSGQLGESHSSIAPFKSIVDSVSKLGHTFRHGEGDGQRNHHCRTVWDALVAQDKYISGIMDVQLRCRDARGKRDAKESQLKSSLAKEGFDSTINGEVIPLPSTPNVLVNGLTPDTAKMFKSALYPALIEFKVDRVLAESDTGREDVGYKVIVKTGDDLRQDQLIIMMIQLMDGLLKHAALDMCLTPYSVIAMSPSSGLVEFVDGAMPISMVLAQYNNSILHFFQDVAPEKGAVLDVKPSVLSTYIRSCAGYCVLTYLLGVGDRHLDNILLRSTGHFFHIDFGFVFGRDPKPLPPAFRLTREMVDGMGGMESANYRTFVSLACQAFNVLRRSAGLVLNLLHLMSDAGIEDLSSNPAADVEGVIARVEERFRLDLNDEQAERYFTGLINDCLAAIAPRVMEIFHSFSVARR